MHMAPWYLFYETFPYTAFAYKKSKYVFVKTNNIREPECQQNIRMRHVLATDFVEFSIQSE